MSVASFFLKATATLISPVRYVEKGVEHVKENLKGDLEEVITNVIKIAVLVVVGFVMTIFFSFTAAVLLNMAFESAYIGFAIMTGFYLIIFLGVMMAKGMVGENGFFRSQAKQMLKSKNNNNGNGH